MKKILLNLLIGLLLCVQLGCGVKSTDVLKDPTVPEYCKDAYVYKLGLYPDVTTAIEVGAIAILAAVENSAEPMKAVCYKAIQEIELGSAQLAFADLLTLFTKDSKYAPAAALAVSQIQTRLKDVILTQCDKDTLISMFNRIIGYAQASKADKV